MTQQDFKDNKVSLAQGIGFAITILIFFIGSWVNLNSRIAVLENQQKDFENSMIILSTVQKEITEVKVSLKYLEQYIKEKKNE